jgi:hypothetical protein
MKATCAIALFLPEAIGSPVQAQSPSLECLEVTQEEVKKGLENAISQEGRPSCGGKQKKSAEICENGECKLGREKADSRNEVLQEKK